MSQPAWYCVHTKPKCEHLVAGALRQFDGVEPWCPRLRFQRSTPRGKVWFTEALFPSYLFARYDPEFSARAVKHANNVIRVVEFGGRPVAVPDQNIAELQREMHGKELREVSFGVRVGDTVYDASLAAQLKRMEQVTLDQARRAIRESVERFAMPT